MKTITTIKTLLASLLILPALSATPPVALRVELDRSILAADTPERAILKVSLDGLRLARPEARQPVNLAIVIDTSGSMSGARIDNAKRAAIEAISRLASDDILSLVTYDSNARTLIPAQRVGTSTARFETIVRNIRIGGTTALYAGVNQGANELRKNIENNRYIHRIILLSDGQANQGPSSPDELGRLGASLARQNISVTTIGIGLGYNEDLMTRLALRSDGNTYFAENSSNLSSIFSDELGDVLNIVARRATIRIEFPEGIRPIHIIGRTGNITTRAAEISIGQIYGGQEKFALVEVEVTPTRANTEREIARAKITCEDISTQRTLELTATQTARFSTDKKLVIASANKRVQSDYADNRIAEVKDEAIALADKGRQKEAAQLLETTAADMKLYGDTYNNTTILVSSSKIQTESETVKQNGYTPAARKTARTETANTYNQQKSSK